MNTLELKKLIIEEWDKAVTATDQPLTLEESRTAIVPAVAAYLESADRDFEAEAVLQINSVLHNERQNRTNQFHREVEWIISYFENPEDAGFGVEALLARAYPMGTVKGEDRALRHWTLDDLQNKILGYYRVAADTTESAKRNDNVLTELMLLMRANGASTVGGLVAQKRVSA